MESLICRRRRFLELGMHVQNTRDTKDHLTLWSLKEALFHFPLHSDISTFCLFYIKWRVLDSISNVNMHLLFKKPRLLNLVVPCITSLLSHGMNPFYLKSGFSHDVEWSFVTQESFQSQKKLT